MKKIFFIFCLISSALVSQNTNFQWAKAAEGNITLGRAVITDTFGNVYAAGYFAGTKDFDPGPGVVLLTGNWMEDIYVCKFGPAGNLIWAKCAAGPYQDFLYSIALDVSGNVYMTGKFQTTVDFDPGPGVFNLTCSGAYDLFIWKLDPSGNFIWAKSASGLNMGAEEGKGITIDPSGNVYVTGFFYGNADFDPGPATFSVSSVTPLMEDIFVLKLDAAGNFMWVKTVGGANSDLARSVAIDPAGNVLLTGEIYGVADLDPGPGSYTLAANTGGYDIFVLKLDAAGNFIWAKCLNGTGVLDKGNTIASDPLGNIYFAGAFTGTTDLDPGPAVYTVTPSVPPFDDLFVSKLDPLGNLLWAKTVQSSCWEGARQLKLDLSGNIYVTGDFGFNTISDFDPGPGIFQLSGNQGSNGFIWKLDASGNFIWAGNIEGNSYSICIDVFGNIYDTGAFISTADFDPGPGVYNITSPGAAMFLLKLASCPVITVQATTQNVTCSGGNNGSISVNSTGSFPVTYSWSPVNSNSGTIIGLGTGIYVCVVSNSCYASVQQSVNLLAVNQSPTVTANSGSICVGQSFTIVAGGANFYAFSGGSPFVSPTVTTSYVITGISNQGCQSVNSATSTVTVKPRPAVYLTVSDSLICAGESVTLTAGGAVIFLWSTGAGSSSIAVSPQAPVMYTVTGTDLNGCSSSAVFNLRVDACTNIIPALHAELETNVFPNPFLNVITVISTEKNQLLEVYTAEGSVIYQKITESEKTEIDLNSMAAGIYIIKIGSGLKKIIKE